MYNNKRMDRNIFQTKKELVEEFSLKSTLFPELVTTNTNITSIHLNYKNSLLDNNVTEYNPIVHIYEKTDKEKELEQKKLFNISANKIIHIMNDRWSKYRLNYIKMYGEDEYEKWYIPLYEWEEKNNSDSDIDSEVESDEENYDY